MLNFQLDGDSHDGSENHPSAANDISPSSLSYPRPPVPGQHVGRRGKVARTERGEGSFTLSSATRGNRNKPALSSTLLLGLHHHRLPALKP